MTGQQRAAFLIGVFFSATSISTTAFSVNHDRRISTKLSSRFSSRYFELNTHGDNQPCETLASETSTVSFQLNRRSAAGSVAAAVLAVGLAPRGALAQSEDKFIKQMANYGIGSPVPVPGGYSPVLGFYGRAVPGQVPLLVTFNAPSTWIIARPNIDNNGEDGTVSAGDYIKGDSAALFVAPAIKDGQTLDDVVNKEYLRDVIFGAITQKGASFVQDFKLLKFSKVQEDKTLKSSTYSVDFQYILITGAGFEVGRRGCGAVTAVGGKSVQAMVGATTTQRWKKVEPDLREVAASFRVYDKVVPTM
eukprot:CAMPEP_0185771156 /NCGR_PEP_ID=MMETSP1174-20130828/63421_1 /TAXON_ID=35687 /ORGANISM="Dictyocha speculum, Strain CCMP1381" /LENGTH=304 /DNA_ID=CAMNT_0028456921 /DNA_START=26 /DNA_END=940 /DNA_ORIENTATION=+